MIIAVNIKMNGKKELDKNDNFIFEAFSRIIKAQPQHIFILISEKPLNDFFISSGNIINAALGPQSVHPAQWHIWHTIKLNAVLKKYKADIFISYIVSPSSLKIPQCIIIPDLDFIHYPQVFKKSHLLFYKTFIPGRIKKSKLLITVSKFCKQDIIKQLKINNDKIKVVYSGIDENYKAIDHNEREKIKEIYANGNEYFIYKGEIGANKNLLNLFKAFSAFKKRQKSNMQLLIAGKQGWKYDDVIESLRLFKFKNDVKIVTGISQEDLAKIVASSYALISIPLYESFTTDAVQALKSCVPVVASSISVMHETLADAALYADPENFKEIAIKMMELFKDENLRNQLIEKGNMQAKKFSWDITANLLWKGIQEKFNA